MKYIILKKEKNILKNWKKNNIKYMTELEKFIDIVSNIKDEKLKNNIIIQMLKCDEALTILSESMFRKYYFNGYEKSKKV